MINAPAAGVFLTGRTSIIGPLLTPLLLAQGMQVHALGRKPLAKGDHRPCLHWSPLNLADPLQSLPVVSAGTVIHTASLWLLPGWLEKFHANGVRRVIAFSSTSRFT